MNLLKIQLLILIGILLLSCKEDDDELSTINQVNNIDFNNSILVTRFNNDFNSDISFIVYNLLTNEKLILPFELPNNSQFFQLIGSNLYFIENSILKSYNLVDNLIKNQTGLPNDCEYVSISQDNRLLAYFNSQKNEIIILDLITHYVLDKIQINSKVNPSWSPSSNYLLLNPIFGIYNLNSKSIITPLNFNGIKKWMNNGKSVFYRKNLDSKNPYFTHRISDNFIYELPTSEKTGIHNGKFSPNDKYFCYNYSPRSYIGDFHYLNTITNKDNLISANGNLPVYRFVWVSSTDDIILFWDLNSIYTWNLLENKLEDKIEIIDNTSEYKLGTRIIPLRR